jgi:hypothetical protein
MYADYIKNDLQKQRREVEDLLVSSLVLMPVSVYGELIKRPLLITRLVRCPGRKRYSEFSASCIRELSPSIYITLTHDAIIPRLYLTVRFLY